MIRYGTFVKSGSVTQQEVTLAATGTFRAMMVWTTYQTATGITTEAMIHDGVADASLAQVTRFIRHGHNSTASSGVSCASAQSERTDRLFYKTEAVAGNSNTTASTAPTVEVEGELIAVSGSEGIATKITIDWLVNDGVDAIVHYIVFTGEAISAKLLPVKCTMAQNASLDVTGVGFDPTTFVVLGGAADEFGTGDYNNNAPFGSIHGFGFSNVTNNYCGWTLSSPRLNAASGCIAGRVTNRCAYINVANAGSTSLASEFSITAALTDGYRIFCHQKLDISHEPIQHVLCLRGVQMGFSLTRTPTPSNVPIEVSFGFNPETVFTQSNGETFSVGGNNARIMMGGWNRSGAQGCAYLGTRNVNPSITRRAHHATAAVDLANDSTGAAGSTRGVVTVPTATQMTAGVGIVVNFSSISTVADIMYIALRSEDEELVGSLAGGQRMRVTVPRAVGFGLRGEEYTHATEGEFLIDGDLRVTGASTIGGVSTASKVTGPSSATDNALVRFDGTTGKLVQNSLITLADAGNFNFPDGVKQIFNPDGTNAGLNVGTHTAEPSSPGNGDLFYDSTANALKARINGRWVSVPMNFEGSGDPEGSVSAPVGAIYRRTNGYVYDKISGTGNTGWEHRPFTSRVTLTDSQIKTVSTPYELFAAPGANRRARLLAASIGYSFVTATYGNVDANYAALQILWDGITGPWAATAVVRDTTTTNPIDALGTMFTGAVHDGFFEMILPSISIDGSWWLPQPFTGASWGSQENKNLAISFDNNGSGNLTGGDGANFIHVITTVRIEKTA